MAIVTTKAEQTSAGRVARLIRHSRRRLGGVIALEAASKPGCAVMY